MEKLQFVEAERTRLNAQVEELQSAAVPQATTATATEARKAELDVALAQALERLKTTDLVAQADQARIADLEKTNQEYRAKEQGQANEVSPSICCPKLPIINALQIDTLKQKVNSAIHERDAAVEVREALQKEHDRVTAQQNHWDDLHRATQQMETLTNLMSQADKEEIKELKKFRDRSHKLEGKHSALQKRFKDQESKMTNNERAANTARQSLAQSQQRARGVAMQSVHPSIKTRSSGGGFRGDSRSRHHIPRSGGGKACIIHVPSCQVPR